MLLPNDMGVIKGAGRLLKHPNTVIIALLLQQQHHHQQPPPKIRNEQLRFFFLFFSFLSILLLPIQSGPCACNIALAHYYIYQGKSTFLFRSLISPVLK